MNEADKGSRGLLGPQGSTYSINTVKQYEEAIDFIKELLEAGAADEKHALAPLVTIIGDAVYKYEVQHNLR